MIVEQPRFPRQTVFSHRKQLSRNIMHKLVWLVPSWQVLGASRTSFAAGELASSFRQMAIARAATSSAPVRLTTESECPARPMQFLCWFHCHCYELVMNISNSTQLEIAKRRNSYRFTIFCEIAAPLCCIPLWPGCGWNDGTPITQKSFWYSSFRTVNLWHHVIKCQSSTNR